MGFFTKRRAWSPRLARWCVRYPTYFFASGVVWIAFIPEPVKTWLMLPVGAAITVLIVVPTFLEDSR